MTRRYKKKPDVPIARTMARLTLDEIMAARTPKGGWTRVTLHKWGVAWPPSAGWIERLTGTSPGPRAFRGEMATIFADGAFNAQSRVMGFGGWIKANGQEGVFVSAANDRCSTSMEAEMQALASTLLAGVDRGLVTRDMAVMLQSDCIGALSIILGFIPGATHSQGDSGDNAPVVAAKKLVPSVRESVGLTMIREIVDQLGLRIYVRHVRGHQTGPGGRTAINVQCDRLAKAAMRNLVRKGNRHEASHT